MPEEDSVPPETSTRLTAMAGMLLLAVVALYVLWSTAEVFLLMFAGVLLAIFLHGIAAPIEKYLHLSRGMAFGVAGLLFFTLLAMALWLFGPPMLHGLQQLAGALPETLQRIMDRMELSEAAVSAAVEERTAALVSPQALARVAGIFSTLLGAFTGVFIVLASGMYIGAEPRLYRSGIVKLFPKLSRSRVEDVLYTVARTLGWWLLARVASMAVVGGFTWIGLAMLGLPFAGILALLAGLLSFIPNIGPILSALPAVMVGFAQELSVGLYVVLLYLAVQTIETYLITPLIERRAVMMPPALALAAQLIFGTLFGILGLLLATPVALSVLVLVKMIYVRDVLEDEAKLV